MHSPRQSDISRNRSDRIHLERFGAVRDNVRVYAQAGTALDEICASVDQGNGGVLAFANAHAFNLAWDDEAFARDLAEADWLLRDGTGVRLLLTAEGQPPGANLNGTDFIPAVLERLKGQRVALFGTCDPWLSKAARDLRNQEINVVTVIDGFQPEEAYLDAVERSQARLIVLAMGMPRQERVARFMRKAGLADDALIICGGAIVDFLAKRHRRAPNILRKFGLEWMFRLALEPRRLFRRYIIGNLLFLHRARKYLRQRTCA